MAAAIVDVWLATPSAALAEAGLALLSAEERARDALFQHQGAREQFLVGRWLVRTVVGARVGEHIQLSLPEDRRTTWSPHLDLRLEADDAGGTKVRGRIGPHPHVWTLFTALHLAVAFSAIGGLMWGLSQLMANESAFALWAVPIALFLHAFIAGAAFIGQGLGADQTYQLRTFLDDVLGV